MKKLICMIPTAGKSKEQIIEETVRVLKQKGYLKPKEEKAPRNEEKGK